MKEQNKMKKLMIAAAIVCAAAMSQAATAKWVASNIYEMGSTTTKATGYIAYFININDYAFDSAKADLAKGDIGFLSKATPGATTTSKSGGATMKDWGNFANGETVTGYLVILNSDSAATAGYAFITDGTASGATGEEGAAASLSFGSQIATQTASNWYAVPEPTSGLLLLLGVAGLALRRRRA